MKKWLGLALAFNFNAGPPQGSAKLIPSYQIQIPLYDGRFFNEIRISTFLIKNKPQFFALTFTFLYLMYFHKIFNLVYMSPLYILLFPLFSYLIYIRVIALQLSMKTRNPSKFKADLFFLFLQIVISVSIVVTIEYI